MLLSHDLNNKPFKERSILDHSNTEIVSYSDPHCTSKNLQATKILLNICKKIIFFLITFFIVARIVLPVPFFVYLFVPFLPSSFIFLRRKPVILMNFQISDNLKKFSTQKLVWKFSRLKRKICSNFLIFQEDIFQWIQFFSWKDF